MLLKYIKKKLIRLGNSSNVLKLWYYYHYIFHDEKLGSIGLDFSSKKTRFQIVKYIIEKKNYKKYQKCGFFRIQLIAR